MTFDIFKNYFISIWEQQTAKINWTEFILLFLILLLASALGCFLWTKETGKQLSFGRQCAISGAVCYLGIILMITLVFRTSGSRGGVDDSIEMLRSTYSCDFSQISQGQVYGQTYLALSQMLYDLLNGLLFFPWGFFMAWLVSPSSAGKKFLYSFLGSFLLSFCVETAQLVTGRGYFEGKDLLINTLGGILGGLLCIWLFALGKSLSRLHPKPAGNEEKE